MSPACDLQVAHKRNHNPPPGAPVHQQAAKHLMESALWRRLSAQNGGGTRPQRPAGGRPRQQSLQCCTHGRRRFPAMQGSPTRVNRMRRRHPARGNTQQISVRPTARPWQHLGLHTLACQANHPTKQQLRCAPASTQPVCCSHAGAEGVAVYASWMRAGHEPRTQPAGRSLTSLCQSLPLQDLPARWDRAA